MLIVQIKDNDNLEKSLRKFKKKFEKTGVLKELRSRQAFEKHSVRRRTEVKKAIYVQNLRREEA